MAKREKVLNKSFKLSGSKKYLLLLEMFGWMKPLNTLSPREKQVLSIIMYYYNKYELLPNSERNRLIFEYGTRQVIADELGITKQVVYNLFLTLKKKDIIGDKEVKIGVIFPDITKLIITFDE